MMLPDWIAMRIMHPTKREIEIYGILKGGIALVRGTTDPKQYNSVRANEIQRVAMDYLEGSSDKTGFESCIKESLENLREGERTLTGIGRHCC